MTDNEIVKALECCQNKNGYDCDDCPYQEIKHFDKEKGFEIMPNGMTYDTLSCDIWLQKDTLDLINRLQAENEKKDRAFEELIKVSRLWKQKYNETKAENEKLKAEVDCYKNWYFNAVEGIKTANDRIDNLLKELGENDGKSR